ncbi:MAG: ATP-dependent DNA ligase [Bacteroidia bacterium]|nr:ATP-dependent DNA ligase [Bacteroidia bacterium]
MFKPMLATDADLTKLVFPLLASAKLDGVRAIVRDGILYSRSNKPIPNKAVQTRFKNLEHFDGELIFGDPTSKSCYRDTVSIVMSHDKPADGVGFFVFDHIEHSNKPYFERYNSLQCRIDTDAVILHEQMKFERLEDVLEYEQQCLDEGYEGLILRSPIAPYKTGRSTVKEGYLLKLKRFSDFEATVIGFEERMENLNEKTTNELGRSARSSHKENKRGRGDLGALLLRTAEGVEFSCGTGFDDSTRIEIWAARDKLLGRIAKIKSFDIGVKDKPRHPVFLGWRDRIDT